MHISHLVIRNFRALEDIECDLAPQVNVVVGPNGVGKTTILQAIRLTKALVAPRIINEAQQVLISLGAASPHYPQKLFIANLARDHSAPVEIRFTAVLTGEEIRNLQGSVPELAQGIVASRLGQGFINPTMLIQFLHSLEGQQALFATTNDLSRAITKIANDKSLVLGVKLNPASGQITPTEPLSGRS